MQWFLWLILNKRLATAPPRSNKFVRVTTGGCGHAAGGGTAQQTGTSRLRFPMV